MKIRFTRRAAADLDAVLTYVDRRSLRAAQNVKARLQAVINLLVEHPRLGPLTGKRDVRRIVANPYPYLVFYRATDTEIIIHAVRHAARRPRGT